MIVDLLNALDCNVGGSVARTVNESITESQKQSVPILLKVTGRTIVASLFAYATDMYPKLVTPLGRVTPVSFVSRRLIELIPVNIASSWKFPHASVLNLTVPKG